MKEERKGKLLERERKADQRGDEGGKKVRTYLSTLDRRRRRLDTTFFLSSFLHFSLSLHSTRITLIWSHLHWPDKASERALAFLSISLPSHLFLFLLSLFLFHSSPFLLITPHLTVIMTTLPSRFTYQHHCPDQLVSATFFTFSSLILNLPSAFFHTVKILLLLECTSLFSIHPKVVRGNSSGRVTQLWSIKWRDGEANKEKHFFLSFFPSFFRIHFSKSRVSSQIVNCLY